MPASRIRQLRAIIVSLLALALLAVPGVASAAQACGVSASFTICLNAPDGLLSGDQPISVTVTGSSSGIAELNFAWGTTTTTTTHLLRDFEEPWVFTWPTSDYLDATQYLNVRVTRTNGTVGAPVWLQLTLENGNDTSVPQNPTNWDTLLIPRSFPGDPVIGAVGDGGDGTILANSVPPSIVSSNAELLLYLGDMGYERGTPAELDYNFGGASFDDPGGAHDWGAMAAFMEPTFGNHEAFNTSTWRDFWHWRPPYRAFDYGGVRFLNLNSECTDPWVGGCGPSSAQFAFVQSQLATAPACVVAFWHRPVLSAVQDNQNMPPIWALLANNGGDLVLNGHTHSMEEYVPLNANLQAGQPDSHMVELIAGSGGHGMIDTIDTDSRNRWEARNVPGAMFVTAIGGGTGNATRLDWAFRDVNGNLVTSPDGTGAGSVLCGTDTVSPTIPGQPSGASNAPGSIDISWAASTDDQATSLTYAVYRDQCAAGGTPVGSVTSSSTTTVSFTDTGLAPGSTHVYCVTASDGTNTSAKSPASAPITVQQGSQVFTDGFTNGFAAWTSVTNLTLDATRFPPGGSAPSARASVTGQAAYAFHTLGATYPTLCMSEAVDLQSISGTVSLMKLRTAGGQSIGRAFVETSRLLKVRGDISGTSFSSGVTLPTGWNTLQMCITVGASGTITLSLNGGQIGSWTTNTGTVPIGRLQIGDDSAKTVTVNIDDVAAGP